MALPSVYMKPHQRSLEHKMSDYPTTFIILCILAVATAGWGIIHGNRIYELPVIASAFVIAWLIPQGIALEGQSYGVSRLDELFWLYVILCLLALIGSFVVARNRQFKTRATNFHFNSTRVLGACWVLLLGGIAAQLTMVTNAVEQESGQWTGSITALYLLIDLRTFAICLAMLAYVHTGKKAFLIVVLIGVVAAFPGLTSAVKRAAVFDTIVASIGAYMFAKRINPPRTAVVAFLIIGTFFINQVGVIRSQVEEGRSVFQVASSGELTENFEYFNVQKHTELQQAKSDFAYISQTGDYAYYANYWNQLTHQYVPAFLVGREFKDSLRIDTVRSMSA